MCVTPKSQTNIQVKKNKKEPQATPKKSPKIRMFPSDQGVNSEPEWNRENLHTKAICNQGEWEPFPSKFSGCVKERNYSQESINELNNKEYEKKMLL